MQTKRIPGKKNSHGADFPILIKTDNWEMVSIDDLLDILDIIIENDSKIYPRKLGYKGGGITMAQILQRLSKHLEYGR